VSPDAFLALLARVWPREHDVQAASEAVTRTRNFGAWHEGRLVGSARMLTDGYFTAMVCEILVDPEYRRLGIGRTLMNRALAASPRGMLFIGSPAQSVGFLERIGCERGPAGFTMRRAASGGTVARTLALALAAISLALATPTVAQRPALSNAVRQFVSIDTTTVALINARIIDGTGAPARLGQTLLIRDGVIATMGDAGSVAVPPDAHRLDMTGKTVIPGLVMVHEHLYYPTGGGVYANLAESFTRLYLAGGVTSMRTAGNMNGYGELAIKAAIDRGQKPGPWIDATAPYLEGPGLGIGQVYALKDADDARRMVNFWADAGATSFKAYMNITREMLSAAIDEAHKRGMKVTGHLCSITYREAAALGIDNVEHGFYAATDFVAGKEVDRCPGQGRGQATVAQLTADSTGFRDLVAELVRSNVAVTATPAIFETFVPGRPLPPGLEVLLPELRQRFEQRHAATARNTTSLYLELFPRASAMEAAFFRAGGLLVAGTDPTGGGGVVPGFSNQRTIELLVESGLTLVEAIQVVTLNGARYLGIADRAGSIHIGKQADLVVIDGDPSTNIQDIRRVELVFRQGIGYDPARLIGSVRGSVGLY
jgi:imidazolonepropionase-like amidohydrolase/GNAT superfamily N-acetyltransferase